MVEQPVVGAGCSTIYEGTPTAVARIADEGGVDTLWVAESLLIKAVTTLDALSNGRARLGIGVGYEALETKAMGIPMPSTAERFERLEETLRLATRMWAGDACNLFDIPDGGKLVRHKLEVLAQHPVDGFGAGRVRCLVRRAVPGDRRPGHRARRRDHPWHSMGRGHHQSRDEPLTRDHLR